MVFKLNIKAFALLTTTAYFTQVAGLTTPQDDNGAVGSLIAPCKADAGGVNLWHKSTCVAYAIANGAFGVDRGGREVNDAILGVTTVRPPPLATSFPELSTNIFQQHSSDGKTWTEQNFIDFYFGVLDNRTHVFPKTLTPTTDAWSNIAAWTGFCDAPDRAVPYSNLNDWFHFSDVAPPAVSAGQCS